MTKTIERLSLIITQVTQLTPRIYHYQLRATSGAELPLITAGSHIAIPVTLNSGKQDFHHYSICSNPNQREYYEIAVRLETNGSGGSIYY